MSTFSLLISPPDASRPGFTESSPCPLRRVRQGAPFGQDMMSYITERSATTHIAVHPELRLVA